MLADTSTIYSHVSAGLAVLGALLLTACTTLLGPDVRVLRCLDWRGRTLAYAVAGWWFFRGVVLTSRPEAQSWAAPVSWAFTTALVAYGLYAVWGERMPPTVRERFDRREAFKKARIQRLVARGEVARAADVAEGTQLDTARDLYAVGVSAKAVDALDSAPDPWAGRES